MNEGYIAVQIVMMPKDANPFGTIFGGVILLRGGIDAGFVTVAVHKVEFKKPVLVGDTVRFVCSVTRIGRTSITMHVDVVAERGKEVIPVTEADVVYVGVDPSLPPADRKPMPLLPNLTP